jgi:hypothetical protein
MNLFLALVMIGLVGGMLARVEALHKEVRALREEIERLRRH